MSGRALPLSLLLLVVAGCQRGCLRDWLSKSGVAGPSGSEGLPLQAVDCPDGLARCVDGVLETSRLYRYSLPCKDAPDHCRCPWDRLGPCPRGCVADGVEMVLPREQASQLCAPEGGDVSYVRPPPERPELQPAWCNGELFRCLGGLVVACEGAGPRALATCVHGCAQEEGFLDDDVPSEAAVAILCAR